MRKLRNTLYITSADAYLYCEGETVVVSDKDQIIGRVPLHNLESIVDFGYKGASPALLGKCAEMGISFCFMTRNGRLLARISGPIKGNVILRETQVRNADNPAKSLFIAKCFIIGKLYNSKWTLQRLTRDHKLRIDEQKVSGSIDIIKHCLIASQNASSEAELMGEEGIAAKAYFDVFNELILRNKDFFVFKGRSRRPPLDAVNALLSFTYSILGNEIAAALETVGMDPYVGFLHKIRPGRKSLALDMLEELRSPVADRFVLTLINLGMFNESDFITKEDGAVILTDDSRKRFLSEWQKHKQEEITHPYLKEKINWGLVPYVQATLLSRYFRDDIDAYPPFLWK